MAVEVVYETHSTTVDNEAGVATGWLPGQLSRAGEDQARLMGTRRRGDGLAAIFSSDLQRARQTVEIAFPDPQVPVLFDWRLRECNYGSLNGGPIGELNHEAHIDVAYPGGESWQAAIARVEQAIRDLPTRWDGSRVLLVGHMATHWALDHLVLGKSIEDLADAPFEWQEGWEYVLTDQ